MKVYDKIVGIYSNQFSEPSEYLDVLAERLVDMDREIMEGERPKLLDAGCGPGTDAIYLSSRGLEVVGVDISKEMIRLARERAVKLLPAGIRPRFLLSDIRNLPFNGQTFHAIVSSFSIIHIPKRDVQRTLESFRRLLKDKGLLYISYQEGESREMFIDEPLKPGERIFVNVISRGEMLGMLDNTGFCPEFERRRESVSEAELPFTKAFMICVKCER